MKATHLRPADFVAQRWRNGGGSTTQLAIHEQDGRWLWRLSVAEVARSGPFSDFTGYRRTLAVLEGTGVRLAIEGRPEVELRAFDPPCRFDGHARTECTLLDGPVKDLNLMVHEGLPEASLVFLQESPRRTLDADWVLAFAIGGSFRAVVGEAEISLARGELLRIDQARGAQLALHPREPDARLALACIRAS